MGRRVYPENDFSLKVHTYLAVNNMSQKQLAKKIKVSPGYLSHVFTGMHAKPSLTLAIKIGEVLRLNPIQLAELINTFDHTINSSILEFNDPTFSLRTIQLEHYDWVRYNFPNSEKIDPILGVCEEAGELAHAALKMKQNIRGTEQEHRDELEDAIGDIMIYLLDVCNKYGFNIEQVLQKTWNTVKQRDWQKNQQNGQVN